ncbi:hypothetical protein J4U02_gp012 [Mycobacterium phage Aziz]|uniref:Uncharacterized protein n=1 Tax=Mycobacterium phage Aziz TaxID=2762281 RepID=A0A7G8LHF0_9CAUD|nr:hypothetical protein J4U02_gp012 [Mycobacterium phage Aziz]ASR75859.1 hypothetical protein SEA_GENEVAB15_12 [Mycobacterium phage GenevaB15]QNJ56672.1 hypothetical protein SEA_AZIZ_12 [Mycobacterium phage Aziz]
MSVSMGRETREWVSALQSPGHGGVVLDDLRDLVDATAGLPGNSQVSVEIGPGTGTIRRPRMVSVQHYSNESGPVAVEVS